MSPEPPGVLRSGDCPAGPAGQPALRHLNVGGADLIVARMPDGQVVAFGARCPHQDTPLDDATFWDGSLRCPRHNYLYDLATGRNILPTDEAEPAALDKLRPGHLDVYPVDERDGWIRVSSTPRPPPSPAAVAGPARRPPPPAPLSDQGGPVVHPCQRVRVAAGAEFELELPTEPRPGHIWRVSTDGAVKVVGERFAPDPPPRHRVRLLAGSGGEAGVRCAYGAAWASAASEVRTFTLTIDPPTATEP